MSPKFLILLFTLFAGSSETTFAAAELTNRWTFNINEEDSVGGNHLRLENGAYVLLSKLIFWANGQFPDDFATLTQPLPFKEKFAVSGLTIEAWYSDHGSERFAPLFHFGDFEGLPADHALTFNHKDLQVNRGTVGHGQLFSIGQSISEFEEHHFVLTLSPAGNMNVWLDGAHKIIDQATTPIPAVNPTFQAIGRNKAGSAFMEGEVNEFRIWTGELVAQEVAMHFNAGRNSIPRKGPSISSFTVDESRYEGEQIEFSWSIDETNAIGTIQIDIKDENDTLIHSATTATGTFSVDAGDAGGETISKSYTLTVQDSNGSLPFRTSTRNSILLPGIPQVSDQIWFTFADQAIDLVLTGNDPNEFPNAGLSYEIVSPPSAGALTGTPPNLVYIPAGVVGQIDSFTYTAFDGKYYSVPKTVTITIDPQPVAPTEIVLNSTEFPWDTGSGNHVTSLSAEDANAHDRHFFTLVPGEGSESNDLFRIVGSTLETNVDFSGAETRVFNIRIRASDPQALFVERTFEIRTVPPVQEEGGIVINEIHHTPPEKYGAEGFIELHNSSSQNRDLSGWSVTGAVNFVFPSGTILEAGGFSVIAQDPEVLLISYDKTAVGQFDGNLDFTSRIIELRDSNFELIDQVEYHDRFPWPVGSDGSGGSMELTNPNLDNSLGSSWRVSNPESSSRIFLRSNDATWSWRPGTSEASDPTSAWQEPDFVEDASWLKNAQTPIGYGNVGFIRFNTLIPDMRGNYSCIFMRNTFSINDGRIPNALRLSIRADDGFVIWINGKFAASSLVDLRQELSISTEPFDFADENVTISRTLSNARDFLRFGENTIAVQIFNHTLDSSDLAFQLYLFEPQENAIPFQPSPGSENYTLEIENPDSKIEDVLHSPKTPTSGDAPVVSASVDDPDGLTEVALEYQVVAPGAYVPAHSPRESLDQWTSPTHPDYILAWTAIPMNDDGLDGDSTAGDGLYSVSLPPVGHRHLVRYRLRVTDSQGKISRAPHADDPSLNFAYFVYDGIPAYGTTEADTMTETLPVYHLLIRDEDYEEAIANIQDFQEIDSTNEYQWSASLVYDGKVYDHVHLRPQDEEEQDLGLGKRSIEILFNPGNLLEVRKQNGDLYEYPWRTLTLTNGQSRENTLTFGLNEAVNQRIYQAAGIPAGDPLFVQWRVIDSETEAPDQWQGDFHGIYLAFEPYDRAFLKRRKLDEGNLYVSNNYLDFNFSRSEKTFTADHGTLGSDDFNLIYSSLDGSSDLEFIRNHVDLEHYYRYRAVGEALRNYDHLPGRRRSMAFYFSPENFAENESHGRLKILPWNTDLTWGPSRRNGHDIVYNSIFESSDFGGDDGSNPELWKEYDSAIREIRDLLWQEGELEQVIDQFASVISPLIAADYARWREAPEDAGNYAHLSGPGTESLEAYVDDMKAFAFLGGTWPGGDDSINPDANDAGTSGTQGRDAWLDLAQVANGANGNPQLLPLTPTLEYRGPAGFPLAGLIFESSAFAFDQGDNSFGSMEWRLARVGVPGALEITPVWESGEITEFQDSITIPSTSVKSGWTYRARVRHQDSSGRWSHWSSPLEFTASSQDLMFSDWLAAQGETDPDTLYGETGLPNLLAFALGADLAAGESSAILLPMFTTVDIGGSSYPALQFRVRQDAANLRYEVEISQDMEQWAEFPLPGGLIVSESDNGDGTVTRIIRSPSSLETLQFLRLKVTHL